VIYEVTIAVDPASAPEYAAWLRQHVLQVLANDGFSRAEIMRADPPTGDRRAHFVVHYTVRDRASLQAYFDDPGPTGAAALRSDGLTRFADRMAASRRILEPLEP